MQNLEYVMAQFENSFELDIQFVFEHYFNRRSISFVCYTFFIRKEDLHCHYLAYLKNTDTCPDT